MRRLLTALLLLVAAATAAPSAAQDKAKCDLSAAVKQISEFKASGDNAKDMTALLRLQNSITAANISCNGLTFTGTTKKVIGPFVLNEGVYKAAVTSKGIFLAGLKPIKDCGESYEAPSMFLSKTDGDTAEVIVTVRQTCRVAIEIGVARAPWTLTFEPLE